MKELISNKAYGLILAIFGLLGLGATTAIAVEKAKIAKDASHKALCTINETFSCNSVMASDQASAFGFPNTYIGFVGFGITIIIGLMYLLSKKELPQALLYVNSIGFILAMVFVFYLAHAAIFDIHALCIYCMIIWFAVANLLFATISKVCKWTHIQNITLVTIMVALFTGVMYYELG